MATGLLDWVVNQKYITDMINNMIKQGVPNGLYCTSVDEPIPLYDQANCETVMGGLHNSQIVFGRDRPASKSSGIGGQGGTQCGMIDLVVGRGAAISAVRMKNGLPPIGDNIKLSPNFAADAARIYITQKTADGGIDKYLGMDGSNVDNTALSAIAMKADSVRVVGRRDVRIVAGGGQFQGFGDEGERDSCGFPIIEAPIPKIEIIAGHTAQPAILEPVVRGYQLKDYLTKKNEVETQMWDLMRDCLEQLTELHSIVLTLSAGSYPPGYARLMENVSKIKETVVACYTIKTAAANSLNDAFVPGYNSILSDRVFIC